MKNFTSGSDVFLSVPLGGGKSLCYTILPWVFDQMRQMAGRSMVIVVSPHHHSREGPGTLQDVAIECVLAEPGSPPPSLSL